MTLRDAHRPAAPAELRNDQCQARELQERAILLVLQCDVGSCEEGSRRTVSPSPAARLVTGLTAYALLTPVALMGAVKTAFASSLRCQAFG